MGLSNRVLAVKGMARRGDAVSAEEGGRLPWIDPVETGLTAECGGCGAAHFVLNVASPRSRTRRREGALAGPGSQFSGLSAEASVR